MKKLMCLGGNYFQSTAVKAAKRLGYYVINVDYLPNNPAHKFADEYHNISTLDMSAVLKLAQELDIDGIISYASDVSAPTAAYVAEKMGLPTNPYETVYTMTRKDLFHPFLRNHGFFVPATAIVQNTKDIATFLEQYKEIILKPVNSSGSKGVSRLDHHSQINEAYSYARQYSKNNDLVVEEFIHREGYQVAGDAFIVDGKIQYFGIANEHFDPDCNPLVPIGESFPSVLSTDKAKLAQTEIQKAITLLGFKNGAINLDFMFDQKGRLFIIELGPRNGGNLITDAICLGCGVDLAEYTVKAAVGDSLNALKETPYNSFVSSYIYHSLEDGKYSHIDISETMKERTILSDLFVKPGENIYRYKNGGFGIGAALLKFKDQNEMLYMMEHMNDYYHVSVN